MSLWQDDDAFPVLQDEDGPVPALCREASNGRADAVKVLIETGADVNELDRVQFSGKSPLHYAIEGRHAEVIALLLQARADPMVLDNFNDPSALGREDTPALKAACQSGSFETFQAFLPHIGSDGLLVKALYWMASQDNVDMLQALLQAYPNAPLNRKFKDRTPLFIASATRQGRMVSTLVGAGADPNALHDCPELDGPTPPGKGLTALHAWAAHSPYISSRAHEKYYPGQAGAPGTEEAFRALVAAGANVRQVNARDSTPLHYATDAAAARLLVEAGADVNAVNARGETVLHLVGDVEALTYLLVDAKAAMNTPTKIGPPMLHCLQGRSNYGGGVARAMVFFDCGADVQAADWQGNTALHLVAQQKRGAYRQNNDDLVLIKKLIQAGGNVNARNKQGQTPIHLLDCSRQEFKMNKDILTALLEAGADLGARDDEGRTPLFLQLEEGTLPNDKQMIELCKNMKAAGAHLDARDKFGRTLLHVVVKFTRDGEAVEWLKQRGCDPKAADHDGSTLFHSTMRRRARSYIVRERPSRLECFQKLAELGVSPTQPDKDGKTPLHVASCIDSTTPQHGQGVRDARMSATRQLDWLLEQQHGDVDAAGDDGITALHLASTFSEHITRRLVDAGADILKETSEGLNCLHLAARACQVNNLGLMLKRLTVLHGKEALASVLSRTVSGSLRTPMHYAAASGRPESVRLLLDAGMAIHSGTYQGSALQGAVRFEVAPPAPPVDDTSNTDDGRAAKDPDERRLDALMDFSDKSTRYVGSVSLQDEFKTTWQRESHESAHIDEILDMLSAHPDFLTQHLVQAIEEAKAKPDAYVLDCLLRLQRKLGMDASVQNDALAIRSSQSQTFQDTIATVGRLTAEEFQSAAQARLFDVCARGIPPERSLQVLPRGKYSCLTILQYAAEAGLPALLEAIGSKENISKLDDAEWWHAQTYSEGGCRFGEAMPLLVTACERPISNLAVLKVLVEHFHIDVNASVQPTGKNWQQYGYSSDESRLGASALHALVFCNHWWQVHEAMPYLLSHGADPNQKDAVGRTPLVLALRLVAECGQRFDKKAVQILLEHGADIYAEDKRGLSCLELAMEDAEIFQMVLKAYKSKSQSISAKALIRAIDRQNPDALDVLLKAGADPNGRQVAEMESFGRNNRNAHVLQLNSDERFPLHHLLTSESLFKGINAARMAASLIAHGADPLAKYQRSTVLHQVLAEGDEVAIDILLSRDIPGLDPNTADDRGLTLFQLACLCNISNKYDKEGGFFYRARDEPTPAARLLSLGGDVHLKDSQGNTALHLLASKTQDRNDVEMIRLVASLAPELVNQRNDAGDAPLHLLLKTGWRTDIAVFDVLLDAGADPTLADADGNTPLHLIMSSGFDIHEVVPQAGPARRAAVDRLLAMPGVDINSRNSARETPAFGCMSSSWVRSIESDNRDNRLAAGTLMELLDARGVDWMARNKKGLSMLDVAAKVGSKDKVKFLMKKGLRLKQKAKKKNK